MSNVFDKQKEQSLKGIDHSKKGSFDAPIHDLIVFINSHKDFFTTSSCSGRIHIFVEVKSVFLVVDLNIFVLKILSEFLFINYTLN